MKVSAWFQNKAERLGVDPIVIAGGGIAAFYTAYELLKQSKADNQLSLSLFLLKKSSLSGALCRPGRRVCQP